MQERRPEGRGDLVSSTCFLTLELQMGPFADGGQRTVLTVSFNEHLIYAGRPTCSI